MSKILLEKRKVSCFTRDGNWDFWGRLGTEIELFLVDKENQRHMLIPSFLIIPDIFLKRVLKDLDRFLKELSRYSGLPIEETE